MNEVDSYKELAARIMMGGSDIIARLFKMIADENEAELMLAMPGLPEDLAATTDREVGEVKESLDALFHKGLALISARTGQYRMCRDVVQFHDTTIAWPEAPQEFLDLWKEWTDKEGDQTAIVADAFFSHPHTRIIPVETALEDKAEVLHHESVKEIIDNAKRIAVIPCACRVVDGKCGLPVDVCIQLNRGADYVMTRGTGREVDKAEAMEILRSAEEAALVHVTMNIDDVGHSICNCCPDCCVGLRVLRSGEVQAVAPSRFQAVIDEEACIGCEACLDRCYFDALTMRDDDDDAKAEVNAEKCVGCGLCAAVCPSNAILFDEVHSVDFIPGSKA